MLSRSGGGGDLWIYYNLILKCFPEDETSLATTIKKFQTEWVPTDNREGMPAGISICKGQQHSRI